MQRSHERGVAVILVPWKVFLTAKAFCRSGRLHIPMAVCVWHSLYQSNANSWEGRARRACVILTLDVLHHYSCMAKIFQVADDLGFAQCLGAEWVCLLGNDK